MKIAVLAANGKVGSLIVSEAVAKGWEVTAFVRGDNRTVAQRFVSKDLLCLDKADLEGFDVVVSAFGTEDESHFDDFVTLGNTVSDALAGTDTKFYIVGGAGSLFIDNEHNIHLVNTPEFPEEFKPLALAQTQQLAAQRERNDVDWVFVSPAIEFEYDAPQTRDYIVAGEKLTFNDKGDSFISYRDFAYALVNIIEDGKYAKERISLLSK